MIKMFMLKAKKTKKTKRIFKVKTILKILILLILGAGIFTLGKAITKDILVNGVEINKFKERAVFEYEEEFLYQVGVYQTRRYYKVPRETSYELADSRSVFYSDSKKSIWAKQKGDIFMSQESPFPDRLFIHPVYFILFWRTCGN